MQFASVGALVQSNLMQQGRKNAFMFDGNVNIDQATENISTWAKSSLAARSILIDIDENNIARGTPAGGVKDSRYYFTYGPLSSPFAATKANVYLIDVNDDTTRGELRYRKWLSHNARTSYDITDPLCGPMSTIRLLDASWYEYAFVSYNPIMLVPESVSDKVTGLSFTSAETRNLNYSTSDNYGNVRSATTYFGTRVYDFASDSLTADAVSTTKVTAGESATFSTKTFKEGWISPFASNRYYNSPRSGGATTTYVNGVGYGQDIIQATDKYYGATSLPTTPAFNYEWASYLVWNGERILCEVLRRGRDFVQNATGNTRLEPNFTFNTMQSPTFVSLIDV